LCITVKVNVYRLEKTWRVRSGQGSWTRPDPTRQGLDPTRPDPPFFSIYRTRPDPTRPDPSRGSTRPGNNSDPTHTIIYSFSAIVFVTRQLSSIILDGHMSSSCCPHVPSPLRNCCAIATPSSTATWRQYDATFFPIVNPASVISSG